MGRITVLLCLICFVWHGSALDRNVVRRAILLHRISKSGSYDPYHSIDADKLRYKRQVGTFPSDDEDFLDGSGEDIVERDEEPTPPPDHPSPSTNDWIWYRTKINFLDSVEYVPALQNYRTPEFAEVSGQIMDLIENHLRNYIPGYFEATPLMFSMKGNDVIVLVDVGSCAAYSFDEISEAVRSLFTATDLSPYRVSSDGFKISYIGTDPGRQECIAGPSLPTDVVADIRVQPTTDFSSAQSVRPSTRPTEPVPPDVTASPRTTLRTTASGLLSVLRTTATARPTRRPVVRPILCREDQATCRNLIQCIDKSYVCDGTRDCDDGSDEPDDCAGGRNRCDPTEFLCLGTGKCAQKTWRCDGDDDCGNGYDEQNCPTSAPGARCPAMHFACGDGACVPTSYQCDGEPDCSDSSDEDGCSAPVVIVPPDRTLTAVEGEDIEMFCEAVGIPSPIISWRVNWGNVPRPPRVTMSTANGRGTLSIKKVKLSDQGAYTCEAINSQGGIFAVPDLVLTVEEKPVLPDNIADETRSDEPCLTGEFDVSTNPDMPENCTRCFCFGITDQCRSSRLEFSEVGISFDKPGDKRQVHLEPAEVEGGKPGTPEPINSNQITVNPAAKELQLIDLSKRFLAAAHYWSLPAQFLGAKINSYGGTLKFSFSYNNSYNFEPRPTNNSDVILEGNGKTLVFQNEGPHPEPTVKHTTNALLRENKWKNSDGTPASREDMMTVLGNLSNILIRTVYDSSMLSSGIGDVSMQVASGERVDEGTSVPVGQIATLVEECECPEGYTGLSCETCDTGYVRQSIGPYLGNCVRDPTAPALRRCEEGYTGDNCDECAEGYEPYLDGCTRYPGTYCDTAGSVGVAVAPGQQCSCKTGCEGLRCDKCKPGYYFLSAANPDGCLSCFCMGITDTCTSTTWNRTQVIPSYRGADYFTLSTADARRTFTGHIRYDVRTNRRRQSIASAEMASLPTDVYYWVMPEEFIGKKITSYGGRLDFTINYNQVDGARPISHAADVIIAGNGVTLDYLSNVQPEPGQDTRYVVVMKEDNWQKSDGSQATRADLMLVLSDINRFLIRATQANRMTESMITDIYLETATARRTGRDRANQVEQCSCPEGYTGLSCEECSPGYHRVRGDYLGRCQKCECNGHSDECEESSGACVDCQHNTVGNNCESCADGYYGTPRFGTEVDCRPCPCPSLDGRTDRGDIATCTMGRNGQPVCDRCPVGYAGDRCERCAPGYAGNPQVPGSACIRQEGSTCQCDPTGSVDTKCDGSGQCNCKPSTSGQKCDRCRAGFFHLSYDNEAGCLPCFCMGVTKQCTSATYQRNKISSDFSRNYGDFTIINRQRTSETSTGLEVVNNGQELSHPRIDTLPRGVAYYWNLPEQYLGDKIVSYGGDLQYTITYTTYGAGLPTNDPEVILIGNDFMLFSKTEPSTIPPNVPTVRLITFREGYWKKSDGRPATREHLLMALADVEYIMIRATYPTTTLRTSISDVSMETASESVLMSEPALEVEQCVCPDGYEGLSCEDCAPGFTRSAGGIYLGLCHSCQCNGHADSCDSETGVCKDCRDHTAGDHCGVCAPGYFGDATRGSRRDCRPCACPGTGDNSFSDTCEFNSVSNILTCTACREGYTGRRCENCARGYVGTPTVPGGRCVREGVPAPIADTGSMPQVTVAPKQLNARKGETVTLRCSVSSRSRVAIDWRRSGARLPSKAILSDKRQTLTLPNVAVSDVGTYECLVRNIYGIGRDSAVISVASERPMIKVRIEEPRRVTAKVGSDVSFVCTGLSKMPAYIITWMKKGGRLPLQRATDFDGILHINNLQRSDSGTYVCTGSNMYSIDRQSASLLVVEADESAMKPIAVVTPSNQSITRGDDAIFYCNVEGNPTPNVEWHRADGQPMPDGAEVSGEMLMIPSATMVDGTLYSCRASNQYGVAEATAALDVFDGSPPTVTVSTPDVTVYIGDDATLECDATGKPAPVFSWTQRGRHLLSNIRKAGKRLRIISATLANRGTYQCSARNPFGEDIGYIRVTVKVREQFKKPVCRTEPKDVTAYVGTNSTITCVVGGNPPPSVAWIRVDGYPLHSNMKVEGAKLFIWEVRESNAGRYVCVATNQAGESRSRMTLHVVQKELPKVKILPSRYLKVLAGSSPSFTCVTNETDADVTWIRGQQRQFTGQTYLAGNNRVLTFENIGVEESGSYVCVASNVVGHREASAYVDVTQMPSITISPGRFIALREGEAISLTCKASGKPMPSVIWKKLNASVDGSSKMLTRYRRRSNVLLVKNAKPRDAGDYSCVAINEAGTVEKKAMIIVHPRVVHEAPAVTVESTTVTGVVGSEVNLHCIAAGSPAPRIMWSRNNANLPEGSHQSEGILHIPNLSPDDVGDYTCQAVNMIGRDEDTVQVMIIAPPSLTIHPSNEAALGGGQSMEFTCMAVNSTQPIVFEWTKDLYEESSSVLFSGSLLQVLEFVPERDSGTYRCTGTNEAGSTTTTLTLHELTPPSVNVSPREITKLVGESVTLHCTASVTGSHVKPEWQRTDGQDLDTERVQITPDGRLTIKHMRRDDAADYECSASNAAGSASMSASVVVHEKPHVTISVVGDEVLVVGGRVKVSCNASGFPEPDVTLMKNGSSLERDEFMSSSLNLSDSGMYSCVATNQVGRAEENVSLLVHGPPLATIDPESVEIRAHQSMTLSCVTNATLATNITWSKREGNVTVNATFTHNDLVISDVNADDAGTYVCTAANLAGSFFTESFVNVHSFVPFFAQTDRSYISYALSDGSFYTSFNITISFRAVALDGILLYAPSDGSDFFSLNLANGFVEYRFDVGSGPMTTRSSVPLEKNRWYTVQVSRIANMGYLSVDGGEVVPGKSQGEFRALDLSGILYVGGVPAGQDIFLPADLQSLAPDSGFYGCISQLIVNKQTVDMGSGAVDRTGIVRCRTCGSGGEDSPCDNDASCTESYKSKKGYVCNCRQGFVGDNCQFEEDLICAEDVCGAHGRCEKDLELELGYRCVCAHGYVGPFCTEMTTTTATTTTTTHAAMRFRNLIDGLFDVKPEDNKLEAKGLRLTVDNSAGVEPLVPSLPPQRDPPQKTVSFNQESYMVTRSVKASLPLRTNIRLRIRRNSRSDGLILYNEDEVDTSGVSTHFIALAMRNNMLEYRFSSGSDVTVLQAPMSAVGVGTWHTIEARRRRGKCKLQVDGVTVARARTSGGALMAVNGPMFLGGVKFWDHVPEKIHVRDGFDGCMEELRINGKRISFDDKFTKKNTGVCDVTINVAVPTLPVSTQHQDHHTVHPRYSARLTGTSYATFHGTAFPHDGVAEQISVSFRTVHPNGLLLFHGQDITSDGEPPPGESTVRGNGGGDFISIGIQNSNLVYSFNLGGGRSRAVSIFPVADGLWHKVVVVRRGTLALMWLDDLKRPVATQSSPSHTDANTPGLVYVGGAPDVTRLTESDYTSGFVGCLKDLRITRISASRLGEVGSKYLDDSPSAALDFSRSGSLERVRLRLCRGTSPAERVLNL